MLENQANLNATAYSDTWLIKGSSGEWNYRLAASQEIAEFVNSYWLPWWSKAEQDMANCRIELVDALHFILSQLLIQADGKIEDALFVMEHEAAEVDYIIDSIEESGAHDVTIELALALQAVLAMGEGFFSVLLALCASINFTVEQLFALYMGKSELNRFRQDNGYKAGTYKKKWDGKSEDNYFLTKWVSEQATPPTVEQIRDFLNTEYAKWK